MSDRINTPEVAPSFRDLDLLADIVSASHVGTSSARGWYAGRWSLRFTAARECGFHIVLEGAVSLELEDGTRHSLGKGDVALVSAPHVLATDLRTKPVAFSPELAAEITVPASEGDTCLLCGAYQLDEAASEHRVFSNLPPVIHLPAGARHASVDGMVGVLDAEFRGHAPGASAVASRLIDAMLVYSLRHWVESDCPRAAGWLKALVDPTLGRALALIHRGYAHPWTLDQLARKAGTSRASLARNFSAQVGTPPMQYLTQHRLEVARGLLEDPALSLDEIAGKVGYSSSFSLSKAFKRTYGQAPRHYGPSAE